ncbi:hypothetical protein RCL1_006240 [Eukaryota sp. TZLM3-RCL]
MESATDPSGRYITYFESLGKGAFKQVYRAVDQERGIECAWNCVRISDYTSKEQDRLMMEVDILKQLDHPNIISLHDHWRDDNNLVFITELMSSGTLRQYLTKVPNIRLSAIKNYARQILDALVYLHTREPKIIHRDLKADNIFINSNHGEVKIGDMGLSTVLRSSHAASVIGTPEFMAKELFHESYNELVDVYSFGMTLLEMTTLDYPFCECSNAAQIFRKVMAGAMPASLDKVSDPEVRSIIELCLLPAAYRPSAKTIRSLPFFEPSSGGFRSFTKLNTWYRSCVPVPPCRVEILNQGDSGAELSLSLPLGEDVKIIEFSFNPELDSPLSIAEEMTSEFGLNCLEKNQIVSAISDVLSDISSPSLPPSPLKERTSSTNIFHEDLTSLMNSDELEEFSSMALEYASIHRKVTEEDEGEVSKDLAELLRQQTEELRNMQRQHLLAYARLREEQQRRSKDTTLNPTTNSTSTVALSPVRDVSLITDITTIDKKNDSVALNLQVETPVIDEVLDPCLLQPFSASATPRTSFDLSSRGKSKPSKEEIDAELKQFSAKILLQLKVPK